MNACKLFNTYSSSESSPTYKRKMINKEVQTKATGAERRRCFALCRYIIHSWMWHMTGRAQMMPFARVGQDACSGQHTGEGRQINKADK